MNKSKKNPKNISNCTLFVEGMHCAACEILVEKKLLEQKSVKQAEASLGKNTVQVSYEGNKPDITKLNQEFKDEGYKFYYDNPKKNKHNAVSNSDGIYIDKNGLSKFVKLGVVILSFIFAFILFEKLNLGKFVSIDSNASLPAFFVLGLIAGISSCAALIGGLLLSLTKKWNDLYSNNDSKFTKSAPHIMFHLGRILSFFFLGAVLGLIGEVISINNTLLFSFLTIAVSIIMLILAFQMLGFNWAYKIRLSTPKFISKSVLDDSRFSTKFAPFIIGASTFFVPCGFTLIAQTSALASGSALSGALIMLFFSLGTLPLLVGISFGSIYANAKANLSKNFNTIAGVLIIFFVLYNINSQMNLLGLPSLSDVSLNSTKTTEVVGDSVVKGDTQIINIEADGFSYVPTNATVIQAGIPAKIVVDNKGIEGCGVFMAAKGLFNGYVQLKSGENVIDLENPKPGKYKLTCSMGMVKPVVIEVI